MYQRKFPAFGGLICVASLTILLTAPHVSAQGLNGPANGQEAGEPSDQGQAPEAASPEAASPEAAQDGAGELRELTNAELTEELRKLQRNLLDANRNMNTVLDFMEAHRESDQRLEALDGRLNTLELTQGDILARLNMILTAMDLQEVDADAPPAGDSDRQLRLMPIMRDQLQTNPDLRKELADAVASEMPKQGVFTVENRTDIDRVIEINRTAFTIPATQTRSFRVALGTVSTQLQGEPLMTWTVGAPAYEQRIQIVPKQQSYTAARPQIDGQASGIGSSSGAALPRTTYLPPVYDSTLPPLYDPTVYSYSPWWW